MSKITKIADVEDVFIIKMKDVHDRDVKVGDK